MENQKKRKNLENDDENSFKRKKLEENRLEDMVSGFQKISVKRKAEAYLKSPSKVKKVENGGVPNLKNLILKDLNHPNIFKNYKTLVKLEESGPEFKEVIKNGKSFWIGIIEKKITNLEEHIEVWNKIVDQVSVKIIMDTAITVQEFFGSTELETREIEIDFPPFVLDLKSRSASIKLFLKNKFTWKQRYNIGGFQ